MSRKMSAQSVTSSITLAHAEAMAQTCEHSLQAIKKTTVEIPSNGVTWISMGEFFKIVSQFEPSDRRLILAEGSAHTFLNALSLRKPLYREFEESVW